MLNLDTHILVVLLSGELSAAESELLISEPLAISDIVLWELAELVELRRLEFDFDDAAFRSFVRSSTIFPITLEIARKSTELDFESDPADRSTLFEVNMTLINRSSFLPQRNDWIHAGGAIGRHAGSQG